MPVGNNTSALAAQKEAIDPMMPALMLLESVFWGRLEAATDVTPVSSRPTRIPTLPYTNGVFSVPGNNFDGGSLGRGSAPEEIAGYVSQASYLQASEWTMQAQWATDSSAKAITNYVTLTRAKSMESLSGYLDVCAQMDGSNTIDTIVSVTTAGLVVNLANYFQSGQPIDIWDKLASNGGTLQATLVVRTEDVDNNTIWTTTAIPANVTAGMLIMVHGASAQPNSGMLGIKYYDVNGNLGNYLGISRASNPGRYIANGLNANNQTLTPSFIRALEVKSVYAIGSKASSEPVIHCGPDMTTAWEANYLGQNQVSTNANRDTALDMLPKNRVKTMGGREVIENPRGTPGRIDLLDLSDWQRLEVKPVGLLNWGGQTDLPVLGSDGGYQSGTLFYLGVQTQVLCRNARRQSFGFNIAIPKGVLNH